MKRTLFLLSLTALTTAGMGSAQAQQFCDDCAHSSPVPGEDRAMPPQDGSDNQVQVIYSQTEVIHTQVVQAAPPGYPQENEGQMSDDDGTLSITSGMPDPVSYGPKPPFRSLDTNGDGVISEDEASAYPLLANDFLYASKGGHTVSAAQYARWGNR